MCRGLTCLLNTCPLQPFSRRLREANLSSPTTSFNALPPLHSFSCFLSLLSVASAVCCFPLGGSVGAAPSGERVVGGVRAGLSAWAPRGPQASRESLRAANLDCTQESRLQGALWALPGVAQSEGQDQGQAWSRATSPGGPRVREQRGGPGFPSGTGGLLTSPSSFPHL